MSENELKETQPVNPVNNGSEGGSTSPKPKKNGGIKLFIIGGIFAVLFITAVASVAGYYSGIANRKAIEANNRSLAASMQYQLGLTDLENGKYDFARQRFEYVIQLDPGFPGVLEKMAEIAIIVNATATPTTAPEATAAPTLDLSGVESMLAQAKQFLVAQDWTSAITALDAIRKENPDFNTVEIDGLYYLALRNRGVQQIYQLGKLEKGIFDIVLMSRFGPMDKEARDASEWAGLYIHGASWYGIDWFKVVKDLEVVYANFPNMLDNSRVTAMERYRTALTGVGDALSAREDWCDAVPYYLQSLQVAENTKVGEAYAKANKKCIELTPTEMPTPLPNNNPVIDAANLPAGSTAAAYLGTLTGSDADGDPFTFMDVSGNLAANGLNLDANGNITGTPTTIGTITFSVQITDSRGGASVYNYSIEVTS